MFLGFFFFSGFCSLVYEVVWLRLAMGVFGVTAPFVSLFLSVFMAGLGLGSWGAGTLCRRLESKPASFSLRLYAGTELLIAFSAVAVPALLTWSRDRLDLSFPGLACGSGAYYLASGSSTAAILLPWCACMGATFPFAMAAIEKRFKARSENSFSYLYLANVIGGALGALACAFVFIEIFGFHKTLSIAAGLNAAIAVIASAASFSPTLSAGVSRGESAAPRPIPPPQADILPLLFTTGLVSMAMEVVWTRQYTPYIGNSVYAFALILGGYLLALFAGLCLYRASIKKKPALYDAAWILSGTLGLLPLCTADPHLPFNGIARVALGILPFCCLLGYLTPALIDRYSSGDPNRAGTAYAVNILGCILGPLIAGFLLLPWMAERYALAILALPLFIAGLLAALRRQRGTSAAGLPKPVRLYAVLAALSAFFVLVSHSYEDRLAARAKGSIRILRDYQATVVAAGQGMKRRLIVNGVGMTKLTPITKIMAHLPLAFLPGPARNVLVICFGMGTTFRSLVSWGVPTTAVELVPSVPRLFGYFHADAEKVLQAPNARIVIDDGRRFLARSTETFDVITMDPAPPMTAAGTSFLYSEEFYAAVKNRLKPDGIVQQWIIPMDPISLSAFAKAIQVSFPYVRVFRSLEGWGYHCLASRAPIPAYGASVLAMRLPPAAAKDIVEFGPYPTARKQFQALLDAEVSINELILPGGEGLKDDRPINEYCFLRNGLARKRRRRVVLSGGRLDPVGREKLSSGAWPASSSSTTTSRSSRSCPRF